MTFKPKFFKESYGLFYAYSITNILYMTPSARNAAEGLVQSLNAIFVDIFAITTIHD